MRAGALSTKLMERRELFEDLATDFFRAAYRLEMNEMTANEVKTLRYGSALRLVPKPTIGYEHIHWQAAEHFEQFDPEEVNYLLKIDDPTKSD